MRAVPAGVVKPGTIAGQLGTWKTGLPDSMICLNGKPRPCSSAGSSLNYIIPLRNSRPPAFSRHETLSKCFDTSDSVPCWNTCMATT